MTVSVRPYSSDDHAHLRRIFHDSIQRGTSAFYTAEERDAWSGRPEAPTLWPARLSDQITFVAELDGQRAGFMTLGHDGHIDLAYVRPEAMGKGVAALLYDRLVGYALENGMPELTTEASHLFRRFLLRQGWEEIARQSVPVGQHSLTNFRMRKGLTKRLG